MTKIIRINRKFIFIIFILFPYLLLADDYFWIGDSGNWSDINHWASTSGGTIIHNTPPSATDDVYFDENSFTSYGQTVSVDAENAVCRNLDWSGATFDPVFAKAGSVNFRIYGSLILNPTMNFTYSGTITLESTEAGNIIQMSGQQLHNNLFFEGINGEWTLSDSLIVNAGIYLNNGSLYTNDNFIQCNGFTSSVSTDRKIYLGKSSVVVLGSWTLSGESLDFDAGTSILTISGGLSNSFGSSFIYNKAIFTGINSSIQNTNVNVYYDSLLFGQSGNIHGNCNINYLSFNNSGSIFDSDTINYVEFGDCGGNQIFGNHKIDTALFFCEGIIEGQNEIYYCKIKDKAKILVNNQIDFLHIGDTAIIKGLNQFGDSYFNGMVYFRGSNYSMYSFLGRDGDFGGNNTFDTLVMSPGFQYIFDHDSTQTINDVWIIDGTCEEPIWLKSTYNGLAAKINKTNGSVIGTHLSLRDINAIGSPSFQAVQSVDLGNNTNWDIDTMAALDLYWVKGEGNWKDPQHWDIMDNGPGGHCPPTEKDNVFFNANSFSGADQSVTINIRNAVCHNMDWTGANKPIFAGPDTNNLKIYGSLKFIDNMDFTFNGETHFEDTLGSQTIVSGNQSFNNNVRFEGTNGGWTLLDKFACLDTSFHERGMLSTDGYSINSKFFFVIDTLEKELYLHSDTVFLSGESLTWFVDATKLGLHADSSVIVTYGNGAVIQSDNSDSLMYHNIHQHGGVAEIINNAYCNFNLVTHDGFASSIHQDCKIDTAIFYDAVSGIYGNDTVKTAIFYGKDSEITGSSVVEIAYYYDVGSVKGSNKIDTVLFYNKGTILNNNEIDTTIIYDNAIITGQNTIRTATLLNSGWFYGNNTFNDLTFTYAKKYLFEHDSTQTIIDNFIANGRCTGNIILMSDFDGKQAMIEKVNGDVGIEYANIRDMKAIGNSAFIANSSVDLGNNEGWDIYTAESLALYWVGGTGDWSDSLHWAPVSGGQGGYCIPSPIDDVYFDENSFTSQYDTVNIDIQNATCRNMDWTGSEIYFPKFIGQTENEMYIYGSLIFNASLNLGYMGETYFESREEGRTISMKGKSFINRVNFRGRGGGWSLMDDFSTNSELIFSHGKLSTGGNKINCWNLVSMDTTLRQIDFDTSIVNALNAVRFNTYKLTVDADSTVINTDNLLTTYYSAPPGVYPYYDTIVYNDVNILGPGRINNDSVYCSYDDILFINEGYIQGDCKIDSIIFQHSGEIFDSDTINFAWFKLTGTLNGGKHVVNSAIFDGSGTITGTNKVKSAIFNSIGSIIGNNTIDTTIIFGNGHVQGNNLFNSIVNIYGTANINGNNTFIDKLTIYGYAYIFDNNQVHDALLLAWGKIGGANIFDILTLTPGNTYTLAVNTTQTINDELHIRGNNCFPITLISSEQNNQATLLVLADTVSGDFIDMRDINATGGNILYAGGHSTDISDNTGWIWEDAPGYIYGLGLDHAYLCEGDTLVLSTENFNGNPDTKYQWDDGTISPTYEVSEPGTYGVLVIYSDDCEVPGQVIVEQLPSPEIDLGEDTEICEGENIEIVSSGDYASYLWNDGTTGTTVTASTTGNYWVEVTGDNGCKNSDTVFLEILPAPHVYLGEDQIIHNYESVILDAGYPGGTFEWSTGDTTQTIVALGLEGGNEYWVMVEYEGCFGSDTILIDEYPFCQVDVPTAFTPNGDGVNDILYVLGSGLEELDFKVFDRYGELVFETNDPDRGWDGTANGIKHEMDVFTYYLRATCFDGVLTEKKGNITLLR